MDKQCEEAFADGIDEACWQVNEYLTISKASYRFINFGLNTVCKVHVGSASFAGWLQSCEARRAELAEAEEAKAKAKETSGSSSS